ncbi:MAG: hypothetical protein RR483_06510, partial [Clostridia bacterium]
YKDKNSLLPDSAQIIINKNLAKIPGASMLLPERVDVWGREQKNDNVLDRAFQNFISPGYYSVKNETEVDKIINNLYKKTGDKDILPKSPAKYTTVNGERKDLTATEYVKLSKETGQTAFNTMEELVKSPAFKSMDDLEKAEAMCKVYMLSKAIGKEKVDNRYNLSSSDEEIINAKKDYGVSKGEYIAGQTLISKIKSDVDEDGEAISGSKKKKVTNAIANSKLSDNAKVAILSGTYDNVADYASVLYDKGLDYVRFAEIYNELSQQESDKNYKGESISGSKTRKLKRVLREYGIYGEQYQIFKKMLNMK